MSVDLETFSDIDIKKAGLYKYAQSPAFDILLIAYAVDDGPVLIVDLTMDAGAEGAGLNAIHWNEFLVRIRDPYTDLYAFNAAFEHYCLNTFFERRGFSSIPLSRWHCTMAHALYCGYSGGLAAVGEAMGLPQDKRKMGIGAALIRKFCVPQKATKAKPVHRVTPEEEPEKWELFKSYCKQDVTTEREIGRRLVRWPMPGREQLLWEITTSANEAGVGVDMDLVRGALEMGAAEQAELEAEAKEISGLENPKSVQQLMKWLNEELDTDEETEVKDLRKGTVADMLAAGVDSDKAARMLELRLLMSKTSTKKFDALEAAVCDDGRVRGMMFYYGASRTGRWAGRIVQPQNLPQNHLAALDFARERVKARDTEMVKACWGSVPDTLSQLIRTAFMPTSGKLYAVADYSAIEARVVAWLAGEQWVLDAFNAGKDIYCATASQMFGVPVEKHGVNAELRQRGKVATLALGYGGGESALVAMGALKMGIPEEDLPEIKQKWRRANPHICQLWRDYEDAAMDVMNTGAPWSLAHGITVGREIDPATNQDFLTIQLPTGRKLFYAHPFLAPAKNFPERDSLHYYGMEQASKKWGTVDTWGGKICENLTQSMARDCLAETLIRLQQIGLTAVFHVHDEVIVEVDREEQLQDVLEIMARPLDWAPGLPLKGAGFTCTYYQKD
jgi:DNA polymerase